MRKIGVVRDQQTLQALEKDWNSLVESSVVKDVAYSYPWYQCWAEHYVPINKMFIITVEDAGRLVALMPLRKQRVSRKGVGVQIIRSMTNRYSPAVFDYISSSPSLDEFAAVLKHAFEVSNTHMMLLDKVPGSSFVVGGIPEACQANGFTYLIRETAGNRLIQIDGTFDAYFNGLKSKFRKNVRAAERKALDKGPLTLVRPGTSQDLLQLLERGFTIEANSWKGRRGSAVLQSRQHREFFFDLAERFIALGWLNVCLLTSNNEDVSFLFCVQNDKVIHALVIGASAEHAQIGPGILIVKKVLEDLFADEYSGLLKFGLGSDRWKRDFSNNQKEDVFQILVFRDSIRGRCLHLLAQMYHRFRVPSGSSG